MGSFVYNLLNSMYLIHASIYFVSIRAKQVHLDSKLWGLIKTKTRKKTFHRFGKSVVLKVRFEERLELLTVKNIIDKLICAQY